MKPAFVALIVLCIITATIALYNWLFLHEIQQAKIRIGFMPPEKVKRVVQIIFILSVAISIVCIFLVVF